MACQSVDLSSPKEQFIVVRLGLQDLLNITQGLIVAAELACAEGSAAQQSGARSSFGERLIIGFDCGHVPTTGFLSISDFLITFTQVERRSIEGGIQLVCLLEGLDGFVHPIEIEVDEAQIVGRSRIVTHLKGRAEEGKSVQGTAAAQVDIA